MRARPLLIVAGPTALPWLIAAAWNLYDHRRHIRLWHP